MVYIHIYIYRERERGIHNPNSSNSSNGGCTILVCMCVDNHTYKQVKCTTAIPYTLVFCLLVPGSVLISVLFFILGSEIPGFQGIYPCKGSNQTKTLADKCCAHAPYISALSGHPGVCLLKLMCCGMFSCSG